MWRNITLALAALLAALGPSEAATLQPALVEKTIGWGAKQGGYPKTYAVGDLKITLSGDHSGKRGAEGPPVLTVASPKFGPATVVGTFGSVTLLAWFFVARVDPKADGPAVVLMSWSGGAHCCLQTDILEPLNGRWVHVDAGSRDADPSDPPKDVDGDGIPDFVENDDNFLYAFACYVCATTPLKVFNLVGGDWIDVSAATRYRLLFKGAAAKLKDGCDQSANGGQNGFCAAYVADAARAGDFKAAWDYMLAHYDRTDTWACPTAAPFSL